MPLKPNSATIFAYQVGFGDCFLLRFDYPDKARHVLIDFGTTGLHAEAESDQLFKIAVDIQEKCHGQLDAVVATHRHADHISGFATKKDGKGSGDVIRALKPTVVVQPWTEEPNLAVNAQGPADAHDTGQQFKHALTSMHHVAQQLLNLIDNESQPFSSAITAQLRFIGTDNLANKSAVENLATMGASQCYVFHGSASGLEKILPGVTTHVLGPPTLRQSEKISRMTSTDKDEYWQIQLKRVIADTAVAGNGVPVFPDQVAAPGGKLPMTVRWLANRVKESRGEQLLQIVRSLDKQMNNTSVILLFETATKKLLFPGDAQIENWQLALSKEKYQKLLADVDVYKVGHHGSRNATPRSMWQKFAKKGLAGKKNRMTSVLSTKPDKHGQVESGTEVPRATLLKELASQTTLHSTHALASGKLYEEIFIQF